MLKNSVKTALKKLALKKSIGNGLKKRAGQWS
jgi:hypothetical protein